MVHKEDSVCWYIRVKGFRLHTVIQRLCEYTRSRAPLGSSVALAGRQTSDNLHSLLRAPLLSQALIPRIHGPFRNSLQGMGIRNCSTTCYTQCTVSLINSPSRHPQVTRIGITLAKEQKRKHSLHVTVRGQSAAEAARPGSSQQARGSCDKGSLATWLMLIEPTPTWGMGSPGGGLPPSCDPALSASAPGYF